MNGFQIPDEHQKKANEDESMLRLLTPKFRKMLWQKFKKTESVEKDLYQNPRLERLSVPLPRTSYQTYKSQLYREMMSTCNIARDENIIVMKNLLSTKKKDFEEEKIDNLHQVNKLLRKKFKIT